MSWVSWRGHRTGTSRFWLFVAVVVVLACGDGTGLVDPTPVTGEGPIVDPTTTPPFEPAQVQGFVLVASTGGPVAGAEVSVGNVTTSTASDGHFMLDDLVAGHTRIRVVASGFEDHESEVTLHVGSIENIALRSSTDPGVTFDLTAPVMTFDSAWGDQAGAFYSAVLTLPADYRTAGGYSGTMAEWRHVWGSHVSPGGTERVTVAMRPDGGFLLSSDRASWTMWGSVSASGNLVGAWACCGHMNGRFEATRRPSD